MGATVFFLVLGLFDPLKLTVDPHQCLSPCDVTVTATAKRDPDNAFLELIIDSPDYNSDTVQPVGPEGVQIPLKLNALEAGDYKVFAVLFRVIKGHVQDVSRQREQFQVR